MTDHAEWLASLKVGDEEHFDWVKARIYDDGILRPAALPPDFDFAANIAHLLAVLSAMRGES